MIEGKPTKSISVWKLAPDDMYTSYNPLKSDGSSNAVEWISLFLSSTPIVKE